jgi:hypothetical protein
LSEREIALAVSRGDRSRIIEHLENFEDFSGDYGDLPALYAAVSGDVALARRLIEEGIAKKQNPISLIWAMLELGDVAGVAEFVRQVDAEPSGPTVLGVMFAVAGSAIWFEPGDAPNFSARMQEAGVDIHSLPRGEWPAAEQ